MKPLTICIPVATPALFHAGQILADAGATLTSAPDDAECLLYPAPTPPEAMGDYTCDKLIIGGNLDFLRPCVGHLDLLKDPYYVAANAAITAEAALGIILSNLECSITEAEILILGWGRIGKCLTHQLKALNAKLTVFARKSEDRSMLRALGYSPITPEELPNALPKFRCIVNTAPAPILTEDDVKQLRSDCYKLDLASVRSIPGDGVLHAKGLPGKCKPEASGNLIANTIVYHLEDLV